MFLSLTVTRRRTGQSPEKADVFACLWTMRCLLSKSGYANKVYLCEVGYGVAFQIDETLTHVAGLRVLGSSRCLLIFNTLITQAKRTEKNQPIMMSDSGRA